MFISRSRDNMLSLITHAYAPPDDFETVRLAAVSFAYLVERNEKLSFIDFAERIAKRHDQTEPRIAATIAALQQACRKANDWDCQQMQETLKGDKHPYVIVTGAGTEQQSEYDSFPSLTLALENCNKLNKRYRGGYDVMRRLSDGTLTTEF